MAEFKYIFFAILAIAINLSVGLAARQIVNRYLPDESRLTRWIAGFEIYFLIIIAVVATLGFLHLIYPVLIVTVGLLAYPLSRLFFKEPEKLASREEPTGQNSYLEVIFSWTTIAFVVFFFFYSLFTCSYEVDPLIYQLVFPVEWLKNHCIEIVPTPFGDVSRAYEPSNTSLYYLWLMVPWHSDFLAHFGQLPFSILLLLVTYALGIKFGLPRQWAYLPLLLILTTPTLFRFSISAYTDVGLAAHTLTAIYFMVLYSIRARRSYLYIFFLSLALMIGTKFIGAVYFFMVLASILFIQRPKEAEARPRIRDGLAFLLILFIGGGFWYLRNFIVTWNPVYPLQVEFFGMEIFPGAFSRAAMVNWRWHLSGWENVRLIFLILYHPIMLGALSVIYLIFVPWLFLKKKINRLEGFIIILPVIWHMVNWYVIPYHMARFWLPVVPLTYLVLLVPGRIKSRYFWLAFFLSVSDLLLREEYLTPISHKEYLYLFPLIAGVSLGIILRKTHPISLSVRMTKAGWAYLSIFLVIVMYLALPVYMQKREEFFRTEELGAGWTLIGNQPRPFTVAWAGNIPPYPLYGPNFENRVRAVAVNQHRGWKYHDYDKYYRDAEIILRPNVSDAQLQHIEMNFEQWWNNLLIEKIDYIFVSKVFFYSLVTLVHDREGWPLEKIWAEAHPECFQLMMIEINSAIYRVDRSAHPEWRDEDRVTTYSPVDALEVYFDNPALSRKFFPNARLMIEKYDLKKLKR